jgi:hypothetical protein
MNSTRPQSPLAPETIFHPAHDWNTIRDTMPLMYSTLTGIRSRSSIKDEIELFATPALQLYRRTFYRAVRAEDTAVSRLGAH